jgi:hypothetical protein
VASGGPPVANRGPVAAMSESRAALERIVERGVFIRGANRPFGELAQRLWVVLPGRPHDVLTRWPEELHALLAGDDELSG